MVETKTVSVVTSPTGQAVIVGAHDVMVYTLVVYTVEMVPSGNVISVVSGLEVCSAVLFVCQYQLSSYRVFSLTVSE